MNAISIDVIIARFGHDIAKLSIMVRDLPGGVPLGIFQMGLKPS
ncbi:MAG: hypothetical protein NDF58_06390 [archaeon YNP-LCB-024-027]|nr:hypothetical protein [Candidatus Culexarchaeum yellowstonense]